MASFRLTVSTVATLRLLVLLALSGQLPAIPKFTYARARGYMMRQTRRCKSQQYSEKSPNREAPPKAHLEPVFSDLEGLIDARPSSRAENGRSRICIVHSCTDIAKVHRALQRSNYGVVGAKRKPKCLEVILRGRVTCVLPTISEWTNGNFRSLNIARDSYCLDCAGGRLVPLDPDIPFIAHLRHSMSIVANTTWLSRLKAAMLDNWPTQSVEARACN